MSPWLYVAAIAGVAGLIALFQWLGRPVCGNCGTALGDSDDPCPKCDQKLK